MYLLHCVRTRQYLSIGEFGTDIKEMDKIKAKMDKNEHENGKSVQEPEVGNQ
ncbi:hypothetical protein Tco_1268513, partial [Tanacetum coccineum]